jgi:hypothetical protein
MPTGETPVERIALSDGTAQLQRIEETHEGETAILRLLTIVMQAIEGKSIPHERGEWAFSDGQLRLERVIQTYDRAQTRQILQEILDGIQPHHTPPPIIWQRDPEYADQRFSNQSNYTFYQAGCYVCALTSLIRWLGYTISIHNVTRDLNDRNAFTGPKLLRPSVLTEVYPQLGDFQRYDWINVPADLELLRHALRRGPVVVQVDFKAAFGVQAHFVTAYEYQPDPQSAQNDRLLCMCPWDGEYIDAAADVITDSEGKRQRGGYFWPQWWNEPWMKNGSRTRVERILHGARIFSLTT